MPNAKFIPAADWTAAPEVDVVDGENLFPQVAAGTYYPILSSTTAIVVPQLTAGSIVQTSPSEGDTLTVTGSNATGAATFQWQKDGVDITGATSATFDTTGEGAGDYRRGVSDGVQGPVYTAAVTIAIDTTAPVLSSATDEASGMTSSTASVSTDEANGTLYWVVTTSATAPSAAQVKAGQDNSGVAATASGSQVVDATGIQDITPAPSGLTAETAYTTHFMHEDAAGNQSAVASAAGFTTDAAPVASVVWSDDFSTDRSADYTLVGSPIFDTVRQAVRRNATQAEVYYVPSPSLGDHYIVAGFDRNDPGNPGDISLVSQNAAGTAGVRLWMRGAFTGPRLYLQNLDSGAQATSVAFADTNLGTNILAGQLLRLRIHDSGTSASVDFSTDDGVTWQELHPNYTNVAISVTTGERVGVFLSQVESECTYLEIGTL